MTDYTDVSVVVQTDQGAIVQVSDATHEIRDGSISSIDLATGSVTREKLGPDVAAALPPTPVAFSAVGDGVADDTAALQALVSAGAGAEVYIPKPAVRYDITSAISVPAGTTVRMHPQAIIRQRTKYTPVFDVIGSPRVMLIIGSLEYVGDRTYTGGSSVRGKNNYEMGSGVWTNSNDTVIDVQGVISGFTCGVCLSSWDGATNSDYNLKRARILRLAVANVDFGLLGSGTDGLYVGRVEGSFALSSGSPNPAHLIYLTVDQKHRSPDVRSGNATGGDAPGYLFKGVRGGSFGSLQSRSTIGR